MREAARRDSPPRYPVLALRSYDSTHNRPNGVDKLVRVLEVLVEGVVDGVLERRLPTRHGNELAAEDLHLGDVGRLLLNVDLAHVDLAGDADERARGREGNTVLAGAGLGDDLLLAHELGEEGLAEALV